MNSSPATLNKAKTTKSHEVAWQRWGMLYLRLALGVSFLSGIADRFGLYRGWNVGYGDFAGFMKYTAQVNSFMPTSTIPAVCATGQKSCHSRRAAQWLPQTNRSG